MTKNVTSAVMGSRKRQGMCGIPLGLWQHNGRALKVITVSVHRFMPCRMPPAVIP